MTDSVLLRGVVESDLPVLFEHQADPEAYRMAAFPARDLDAFTAHWTKLMVNDAVTKRAILFNGHVAGNIVSFDHEGQREVGYWIGREYWGKGIATLALARFLTIETTRPLYAYVAKHNIASARVLQKCGFTICGECGGPTVPGEERVEDFILVLHNLEEETMADKKIIAVLGATGAQGGGLARAILNDKTSPFSVRAVTRDPASDKAKELAALGAAVVAADVDDAASLERAFAGAHGAYCVTFFWAHLSPEKELAQAGAMAQAAKRAGLEHVIWSTFEDTRKRVPLTDDRMPTLMGKYKVPHFDAKGEANQLFTALGVPTTFLLTSFYWDNLIYFGMGPQRGPDGKLAITMPMGDKKLPGMAAEDIGKCAYGLFKKGREYVGKTVGIAGEHLTGAQMAAALTRALGQEVRYNSVSPEVYRGFGFPGADDLGNMFQYKRDFEEAYCGARDVSLSRALNPELQTFDTWLARNKSRIPLG